MSLPEHRYSGTEATRLLCVGVYQDAGFRRQVLKELIEHRERPVAPANGVDVLPVLSHALRVSRLEARAALLMLGAWVGFYLSDVMMFWDSLADRWGDGADIHYSDVQTALFQGDDRLTDGLPLPWSLLYALVALALWFARAAGERGGSAARSAGLPDPVAKAADGAGSLISFGAWGLTLFYWCWYLNALLHGHAQTPYPLLFPLAMALIAWWYQTAQHTHLCRWLTRWTFPAATQPDLPARPLFKRLCEDVRREQEAALTLYDEESPFLGLGEQGASWSFAMELRRRPRTPGATGPGDGDTGTGTGTGTGTDSGSGSGSGSGEGVLPRQAAGCLSAESALAMIEPQLTALRESAARTGKDRLRDLEIDRVVYLRGGVARAEEVEVGGVGDPSNALTQGDGQHRGRTVYDPAQVAAHLREGVDEGGEGRRVFLRIRVGAWHEQLVVTVLVRVHTQGRMLVLEVVPYVLGPIRKEFRAVDAFVDKLPETWVRAALRALRAAPVIGVESGLGGFATLRSTLTARRSDRDRLPDVPRVSLRALACTGRLSAFQEMDSTRYVKTIQERIVNGLREALKAHGYRTEEFEQHVYQLSGGSVFIQDMSGGAVATGSHGSAAHHAAGPQPPKNPAADASTTS
ncbi:hypothetical protein [Streptomyces galbus]|uniref:Uncharacterized protein n=1 Tax=Streptomyces galbus TaxID=33898 RepID=A0A4U5X038_STRGB|nr:hypothetical protein [Streptomyces galbus]TKT08000.1 hypothetical protein E4U92_18440 [Streptomyces galbus]